MSMQRTEDPPSLTQGLYERLRSQLLHGQFRPGERLKIAELGDALSGNLSAVREALARLTSDGLVVAEPQRGFRVAPMSAEDLRSLTEARVRIEALCVDLAIQRGDVAWEADIVAALHGLLRTPRGDGDTSTLEWARVHDQFHRSLVAACGNPWLLRTREGLTAQAERYRWFSMAASGKKRNLDKEHREIADAFLARDSARATQLVQRHIQQTTDIVLKAGLSDVRRVDREVERVSSV